MIHDIKVKRLDPRAQLPEYQSDGASGFDLRALLTDDVVVHPGCRVTIPTGLAFEIPRGYELQVRSRSSVASRDGLVIVNSPGTIDADYRGEVKLLILNVSTGFVPPIAIKNGDRLAQAVLCPVEKAFFVEVEELSSTVRGAAGIGSTGKN